MWGDGKCDILEKIQLRFCKYILAVNKSTCSNMVYGELGITPLDIDIKARMITYWAKLVNEDQSEISHMIYTLLYKLDEFNIFKSNWLSSIRCTLNDSGFPGIWLAQSLPCSVSTFRNILKLRLKDQFIQKWHESISESRKCINYRIFKNHVKLEKYLVDLHDNLRKILTKFRCRNHRLPIERGCQENNLSNSHRIYITYHSQLSPGMSVLPLRKVIRNKLLVTCYLQTTQCHLTKIRIF